MALKKTSSTNTPVQFVFGKSNYRLMLLAIAVIVLGFILMIGETDIYDFRKTVLAPVVVLVGFGIGFYSILKKRDN
ncbi:DUF3098 domain-containing protein [Desertivirga arenae]|uniref:DUF3098 domain-containing protein n=1 Tax=Desertivirga arenae TaxID=2810309 RepID=UPI001A97C78D|nr:DUF3098 domain-containing protein [Pedobacter sp. SYSU D00823]